MNELERIIEALDNLRDDLREERNLAEDALDEGIDHFVTDEKWDELSTAARNARYKVDTIESLLYAARDALAFFNSMD